VCTVTFVSSANKTIITSNRDEQALRQAIEPKEYEICGKTVIFPKDPQAGGTWYAVDQSGNVEVLLNGAAEKHAWNPPYRKSRGLVVLDVIGGKSPIEVWNRYDLAEIEPFTLILFQDGRLWQLRWDGIEKDTQEIDAAQNHIWSSSMLYPKEIREKREKWFAQFMKFNRHATGKDMMHFHHYTESGDIENGLVINRNNFLKTLSITQTAIHDNKVKIHYLDLARQRGYEQSFVIAGA
jgi:uncharacterized protein with NRDE domain